MFRISRIASHITQTACQNVIVHTRNRTGWQGLLTIQRCYSKKGDTGDKETPDCKPPKPKVQTCTPVPVDYNYGRAPMKPSQDCPKPNRMDKMPTPKGSHEKHSGRQRKTFLIVLVVGALVFLISSAVLYKIATPAETRTKRTGRRYKRPKVPKKIPEQAKDIPQSVPYLLIGGGTAAFSAFRAIKSSEPQAKVLVISSEEDFPYMRPPLSKEIWFNTDPKAVRTLTFKQWNGSERSLFYEPEDFYIPCKDLMQSANGGVAVARGWTISHINVVERKAFLDNGYEINYDKCLIATGAVPKNLDIFAKADPKVQEKVTLYREIFDYQELHEITEHAEKIAVIGGGFLGSELACALSRRGKGKYTIIQIFREGGNMGKILPEYLSFWTTEKVKAEGVEVIPYAEVIGVDINRDGQLNIKLSNGKTIDADHAIVAVGAEPNTKLAEKSDLEVDPDLGGYLVNTELQARSHLYIAGDCACFYDTKLGRRRVEHHDHAVVSGRLAGENMTGAAKPYWHQSMFWSDLGPDVGYEAIGIVDSTLPTVGVFAKATAEDNPKAVVSATGEGIRSTTEALVPPECEKFVKADPEQRKLVEKLKKEANKTGEGEDFGKGIIFYLRNDIVVGIVLWNVFNRMNVARQVLKDERKYDDLNEVAKLFNIHEE